MSESNSDSGRLSGALDAIRTSIGRDDHDGAADAAGSEADSDGTPSGQDVSEARARAKARRLKQRRDEERDGEEGDGEEGDGGGAPEADLREVADTDTKADTGDGDAGADGGVLSTAVETIAERRKQRKRAKQRDQAERERAQRQARQEFRQERAEKLRAQAKQAEKQRLKRRSSLFDTGSAQQSGTASGLFGGATGGAGIGVVGSFGPAPEAEAAVDPFREFDRDGDDGGDDLPKVDAPDPLAPTATVDADSPLAAESGQPPDPFGSALDQLDRSPDTGRGGGAQPVGGVRGALDEGDGESDGLPDVGLPEAGFDAALSGADGGGGGGRPPVADVGIPGLTAPPQQRDADDIPQVGEPLADQIDAQWR